MGSRKGQDCMVNFATFVFGEIEESPQFVDKLEGEVWNFGVESGENLDWRVIIEKDRRGAKREWEEGVKEWKLEGMVGVSDASCINTRMGIEGKRWMYERRYRSWRESRSYGLTVAEGEMEEAARILEEVRGYEGENRILRMGVDNIEVLKALRKVRGLCGEREPKVREWGKELVRKGWKIEWRWVPGHEGISENVEANRLAKEGGYQECERDNNVLSREVWEQRRKERVEKV